MTVDLLDRDDRTASSADIGRRVDRLADTRVYGRTNPNGSMFVGWAMLPVKGLPPETLAATVNWSLTALDQQFSKRLPAKRSRADVLLGLEHALLENESFRSVLQRAYADAAKFLTTLPGNLGDPIAFAADDGEVVLEWRGGPSRRAIVSFEGDGAFGYALLKEGRFEGGSDDGRVGDRIPLDLEDYVSGFATK